MNKVHFWETLETLKHEPSKEVELEFFKMLSNSVFLVPIIKQNIGKDRSVSMICNSSGDFYIPAFLSKDTDTGNFKYGEFIAMSYKSLKHLMVDNPNEIKGIALHPFSENFIINYELIWAVDQRLEGMGVKKVQHSGKMKLWNPNSLSDIFKADLKRFFKSHSEVSKVWILMAQGETEKQPHWLFLINFLGQRTDLFPKLAEVIKPHMQSGMCFELMQYCESHEAELLKNAHTFYTSETTKTIH